jgi:hypothetical protein
MLYFTGIILVLPPSWHDDVWHALGCAMAQELSCWLSPLRPGFNPLPVPMEIVVGKVALWQVFLWVLRFPIIIPPILHTCVSLMLHTCILLIYHWCYIIVAVSSMLLFWAIMDCVCEQDNKCKVWSGTVCYLLPVLPHWTCAVNSSVAEAKMDMHLAILQTNMSKKLYISWFIIRNKILISDFVCRG